MEKDRWAKARQRRYAKVREGKMPFSNFDYRMLLREAESINLAFLQQEDGRVELEQCVRENQFFSRAIEENCFWKLVKAFRMERSKETMPSSQKLVQIISQGRTFKNNSFRELFQLVLYGRLTYLQRTNRNWVEEIPNGFRVSVSFSELTVKFFLGDQVTEVESRFQDWAKEQIKEKMISEQERFERQVEVLTEFLEISEEDARLEIQKERL